MTPDEMLAIDQFWRDEQVLADVERLFNLQRLEDTAREKAILDNLAAMARHQYAPDSMPFMTSSEIAEKVIMLTGGNASGFTLESDTERAFNINTEMLRIALGEDQTSALYSTPTAHAILSHWYNPDSTGFAEHTKMAIDNFLTNERKKVLLERIMDKTLSSPFSDEEAQQFLLDQGAILPPAQQSTESPTLGTEDPAEEFGRLEAKAEADWLKYQLVQDVRVQAQMEMNRIMQENPSWVERTVVDKLGDKIKYGIEKVINPNYLRYPSEPVFGHSLSKMDSNGRVIEHYLNFKRSLNGPLVEFMRHDLPDEVYAIAAQKCRLNGIVKPHIGCTFRTPSDAIVFMEHTVKALVDSGYSLDDISVDRHLQTAFDDYKRRMSMVFTISEAPEPGTDMTPELPKEERLQEEIALDLNTQINSPITPVTDDLNNQEKGLTPKDLNTDKIRDLLSYAPLLQESELTWNDMQTQAGLSPTSRETTEEIKAYVGSLLDKADPEHPNYLGDKFGINQAKLLRDLGLALLIPTYGEDKARRAFITVKDKITQDAERNNEMVNAQQHDNQYQGEQPGPVAYNGIERLEDETNTAMPPYEPPTSNEPVDFVPAEIPMPSTTELDEYDQMMMMSQSEQHHEPVDAHLHRGNESPPQNETIAPVQAATQVTSPLLLNKDVNRFNCGGANLNADIASKWKEVAETPLHEMNGDQLLALAAMSHHEWGMLSQLDWLTRREAKLIERASQEVHNALVPFQPDGEPISPLQQHLATVLPEHLIPQHITQPGKSLEQKTEQAESLPDTTYARPKRH